nr:restriction endonuclease subunit S [Blastococcus haudaquaticus]
MGDALRLERRPVQVDPTAQYSPIGVRSFAKGLIRYQACTGAELSKLRYFELPAESLVVSNIKAWEGAVAVAGKGDVDLVASNRFLAYVPVIDDLCVRYIWHYFASDAGTTALSKASPGSADRNRTLGIKAFEALSVPLPSLPEQQEYVAYLDRLFAMSAQSEEATNSAVAVVASLRNQLVRNSDHIEVGLGELASQVQRPRAVLPNETFRTAGVRWYGEGLFERDVLPGSAIEAKLLYEVKPGDLVYNRLFAWKGSFALASKSHDGLVVSSEFPTLRIDEDRVLPEFLREWLALPSVWDRVISLSSGGTPTSRNRLKVEALLTLKVPLPSLAAQRTIVARLERCRETLVAVRRRTELSDALPQAARNEVFSKLD